MIAEQGGDVVLTGVAHFDLAQTLDSGQCFRWAPASPGTWEGVAMGRLCRVSQAGDRLVFHNMGLGEFQALWLDYFDLNRDYCQVKDLLRRDPAMRRAVDFAPGIRVLRQEPWEALCSFLFSMNNNIPRIKGLVERLCYQFGPKGDGFYAFPGPEILAPLTLEDLAPVRAGFRAKYILDAARRVASGQLALDKLADMPTQEAREALQAIYGVGPKVADCVLLYGLGHSDAVPEDVWIKRALASLYPHGMPAVFAPVGGLAQQYLFHYFRVGGAAP